MDTGRSHLPGRPRTFPPATPNSPDSNSHRECPGPGDERRSQSEGANPGSSSREGLLYACEDCGLRFKDAPSRNRHQTVMHYSSEGREGDEGQGEELSTNKSVGSNSGE